VSGFDELLRRWDGEHVVIRHDAESDAWMFVCIHSSVRGPAGGGTRMRVYGTPAEGLADGMRLSAGMTQKFAVVDAPFGGGKAVLAVPELPEGESRRRLLLRYGDLVTSLGGSFRTAADINTSVADLDVIAERCPYVYGRSEANGGAGDSGRGTARGVYHGIRASLRHAFGSDDPARRSVLVQGVGSVGGRVARALAADGAELLLSDVEADRVSALAAELGARVVAPGAVAGEPCDLYAPCAVGAVLSARTIPRLRCRIVAGAANNQLETAADADRLHEAGILYAPDYVINAGGVLQLVGLEDLGWDEAALETHLAAIGDTLARIFREADEEGVSTERAASRLAAERLRPPVD
jgi:leucine dehydrogenase